LSARPSSRSSGALLALALLGGTGAVHAEHAPAPDPAWAQTLRVAQYNVQFVTPWGFGRVSAKHWPNTAARARAIGETLACFDIVALNETINAARRSEIFAAMEHAGAACGRPSKLAGGRHFEVLAGPGPDAPSLARLADWLTGDAAMAWVGDEVAIASRLPIVASAAMAYSTARGSDALAAKGALHARLWRGGNARAATSSTCSSPTSKPTTPTSVKRSSASLRPSSASVRTLPCPRSCWAI
jgi:hypothetical protein